VVQHFTPESILFFLKAGNSILAQGLQSGLFIMHNDSLVLIPGSQLLKNALIRSAVAFSSDSIILGTASRGLYLYEVGKKRFSRWVTEADELLINGQINCGTLAGDSVYCIGTIGSGVVAINKKGKFLWHFSKEYSLPTNTVLYLFTDRQNNIWAALDQGLAVIRMNAPVRYISVASQNIELVYTAIRFHGNLYIGTNQGVFRLSDDGREFNMIPGTQGQVWQLVDMDNQLLCGHNEGTFRIEKDRIIPLSTVTGGTSLKSVYSAGKEYLIQGTYGWLVVYKKDATGKWVYSHFVNGFSHPVKYLEVDQLGYVWASHFIKGLYRIKLNEDLTEVVDVRSFGTRDSLPSDFKINVANIGGRVVFCTGSRFYTFDDLKGKMVPYTRLNRMTGESAKAHKVIPAGNNMHWLVSKGNFSLIKMENDSLSLVDIVPFSLFNDNLIDENEYVATLGNGEYLFCLENGLALYRVPAAKKTDSFQPGVLIRQVRVSSNKSSLVLPLITGPRQKVTIPYWFRRIMFTFAYPDYTGGDVTLHCVLKGRRETIADTVTRQLITYAFLEPGQYELTVEATDENNRPLGTAKYYFSVRPPFWASVPAYLFYVCVLLLAAWITWRMFRRHVLEQNEKVRQEQAKLQQERIERREQKITLLKNEKLEAELRHKSKELASSTMAIIRKNEMLLQLKKEVENHKKKLGNQYPNKYADQLMRMINDNISSDDDWKTFQENFDLIHENFFRHLKASYPDITAHDLKLCAYIRLNLSTKEMASLLNITIRGVEAARYRMRKKFGIPAEKNLTEFLIEVK
jgi:DNA-binding CsgD family transcriptional regulator